MTKTEEESPEGSTPKSLAEVDDEEDDEDDVSKPTAVLQQEGDVEVDDEENDEDGVSKPTAALQQVGDNITSGGGSLPQCVEGPCRAVAGDSPASQEINEAVVDEGKLSLEQRSLVSTGYLHRGGSKFINEIVRRLMIPVKPQHAPQIHADAKANASPPKVKVPRGVSMREDNVVSLIRGDVLTIKHLLHMAGVRDLDQINKANRTFRRSGMTIALNIHYHNRSPWHVFGGMEKPDYTLDATIRPSTEFQHMYAEPRAGDANRDERKLFKWHGINLLVIQTGEIVSLDVMGLIIVVTASLSMIAVANMVLDITAQLCFPEFKEAKYKRVEIKNDATMTTTLRRFVTGQDLGSNPVDIENGAGLQSTGALPEDETVLQSPNARPA